MNKVNTRINVRSTRNGYTLYHIYTTLWIKRRVESNVNSKRQQEGDNKLQKLILRPIIYLENLLIELGEDFTFERAIFW